MISNNALNISFSTFGEQHGSSFHTHRTIVEGRHNVWLNAQTLPPPRQAYNSTLPSNTDVLLNELTSYNYKLNPLEPEGTCYYRTNVIAPSIHTIKSYGTYKDFTTANLHWMSLPENAVQGSYEERMNHAASLIHNAIGKGIKAVSKLQPVDHHSPTEIHLKNPLPDGSMRVIRLLYKGFEPSIKDKGIGTIKYLYTMLSSYKAVRTHYFSYTGVKFKNAVSSMTDLVNNEAEAKLNMENAITSKEKSDTRKAWRKASAALSEKESADKGLELLFKNLLFLVHEAEIELRGKNDPTKDYAYHQFANTVNVSSQAYYEPQYGIAPEASSKRYIQIRLVLRYSSNLTNNPRALNEGDVVLRTKFFLYGSLSVSDIMELLSLAFQSYQEWEINNGTVFQVTVVESSSTNAFTRGAGKNKIQSWTGEKACRSVLTSTVNDGMCAARALVTVYEHKFGTVERYRKMCHKKCKLQEKEAIALHTKASVPIRNDGVSFDNLEAFAVALNVQIMVIHNSTVRESSGNEFIFRTSIDLPDRRLVLMHENPNVNAPYGHFSAVLKVHTLLGCYNYCMKCLTKIISRHEHVCGKNKCNICKTEKCDVVHPLDMSKAVWSKCNDCNRKFPSAKCFEAHKESTCATIKKCGMCGARLNMSKNSKPHDCNEVKVTKPMKCMHCEVELEDGKGHICYIQPIVEEVVSEEIGVNAPSKLIFFDFETTQYLGPHVVNYAVAMYNDSNEVFEFKTLDEFCKWLFNKQTHDGFTAIAHNGKGYDFQFIRSWCFRNQYSITWISNGLKIMTMTDKSSNVKLVDSLNFLTMPLDSFTKTFGFKKSIDGFDLKKGFFPHFFNTPYNVANYKGVVPALKYFGPGHMNPKKRAECEKWWNERYNAMEIYDFAKELREYCISDVRLLKAGCLELQRMFIAETDIDPWKKITIASTCMDVYRKGYLPINTVIRDIPSFDLTITAEYRFEWMYTMIVNKRNASHFELPEMSNPTQHGVEYDSHGDVKTIFVYLRDYDDGNCSIYPGMLLCYYVYNTYIHMCSYIYIIGNTFIKSRGMQMSEVASRRMKRLDKLSEQHNNAPVITIWHSEWCEMRNDDEYKMIREDPLWGGNNYTKPLNPRHAFFGGRTNAIKLQYEFKPGEYGVYADICSMYPAVNYYDAYPIGMPVKYKQKNGHWYIDECNTDGRWTTRYVGSSLDISSMFGFISCTMQCPKNLYHPVLPSRSSDGKLTFDLISPKKGTWTTIEVNKALQMGYSFIEVTEVWHYTKSSSLFKGYVEKFIKLKQEATGYPEEIENDVSKQDEYRENFYRKMGIKLDHKQIKLNPGKRALAKLCLNSLWGKFGQRTNLVQTKIVYNAEDLNKIMTDVRYEITNVTQITNTATEVGYILKDEFISNSASIGDVNMCIAAYTTSHARLRLYYALELLDKQVIYHDTDSVIYVNRPLVNGNKTLEFGDYLGEWTDELDGCPIVDTFISSGPKSYSYTYISKSGSKITTTKVKGFTLNSRNSAIIDHFSMQKLVQGMGRTCLQTCNPRRIRLAKNCNRPVNSVKEYKTMGFTYSTRHIILENGDVNGTIDTLPFGHEDYDPHKCAILYNRSEAMQLENAESSDDEWSINGADDYEDAESIEREEDENIEESYDMISRNDIVLNSMFIDSNDREHLDYMQDYMSTISLDP